MTEHSVDTDGQTDGAVAAKAGDKMKQILSETSGKAQAPQPGPNATFYKVPAGVLMAVRQTLGQLPYDQVGQIIQALETQATKLE